MAAFRFWRENGIKVLLTIEAGKDESEDANILELCQFIADNKYEKDVEGVALWNGASQLCLVMVNSTSEPAEVLLRAKK